MKKHSSNLEDLIKVKQAKDVFVFFYDKNKNYNIAKMSKILKVSRQSIYKWMAEINNQ